MWTEELPGLKYQSRCIKCWKSGPIESSFSEALKKFWEQEKTMSIPSDPKEAYKKGVEDGTDPSNWTGFNWTGERKVTDVLSEVRKKLLTKKVTKYVNVFESPSFVDPAGAYFGTGAIFDTEHEAKNAYSTTSKNFLGTYPIEIEVEI